MAKRKRWIELEEKRKEQEIELEKYLINLVLNSNPENESSHESQV